MAQEIFDYDRIDPGHYDRVFNRGRGIQSTWHRMKFQRLRDELGDYGRHLDVGCGPGTFIGTLDPTKPSVGVDVASGQIEFAQATHQKGKHIFKVVEPRKRLPFDDATFDIVTVNDLIEHLIEKEIHALLDEVGRVTEPGGRLIVTTPNYRSAWPLVEWTMIRLAAVSRRNKVAWQIEDQHVTFFDRHRLATLLSGAGFYDVRVRAFMWIAPFAAIFGQAVAQAVDRWEPTALRSRMGLSLLATARRR